MFSIWPASKNATSKRSIKFWMPSAVPLSVLINSLYDINNYLRTRLGQLDKPRKASAVSNIGVRLVFLLLITTIVVVPTIFLRDTAIHWLLLDMKHQHDMAVSLISRPLIYSTVIWVFIWRNVTSFLHWVICGWVLLLILYPLLFLVLEVTGTQIGILTMNPEPATRYTLYGVLFLFEFLLVFVIAGISHRVFVSRDWAWWPTPSK